jgi:DNA uptake protein ComE-like DNA-binding protein
VLRYREQKGVDSVERLDEVPGLPKTLIDQLKQRLAA